MKEETKSNKSFYIAIGVTLLVFGIVGFLYFQNRKFLKANPVDSDKTK